MSKGKLIKTVLKYVLIPVLLLCAVIFVFGIAYHSHVQHKFQAETKITASGGTDSLERVTLGGLEQWILLRGHDKTNPVLLFLHGGPGSTMMPWHRTFHTQLEAHFTVVHWDQRGAGKSFDSDIAPVSMTIEQFISDTRELVELLTRRFNAPKVYLVGHSWGSELGTHVVKRYPELFYAYVGLGQVVDNLEAEGISYRFAVEKAEELGNEKAIRELGEIGPPPYDMEESMRKWEFVAELGGVFRSSLSINSFFKLGLKSPDYSLGDWLKFYRGIFFSQEHMYDQINNDTHFFVQIPKIEIPVYFFLGRYDYVTPFEIAERYYQALDAPAGKQIVWFENSGHMVPYEEPVKFCDILINKVLKETYPKASAEGVADRQ
ncbi:MAG: alpha/beta hydrolase [Deltaproteobacteria bacterium]|nr:alpha/beta hydrolase [Deltaproteobacteria bacterium]